MSPVLPPSGDPNVGSNFGNLVKSNDDRPPTPSIFRVDLSDDREHVQFTVGYTSVPLMRAKISEFRIYFIPASIFSATNSPFGVGGTQAGNYSLYYGSSLVTTVGLSRDGSPTVTLNRYYCGKDGAFFAVSVNLAKHLESTPTPPCANPTAQYSANGATIPADVTVAQASFNLTLINNTKMLQVNVAAKPPAPKYATGTVSTSGTTVSWASGQQFSYTWVNQNILINGVYYLISAVTSSSLLTISSTAGTQTSVPYTYGTDSFAGFQIYIQNENNQDAFMQTYREGPFFSVVNGTNSSGFINGSFNLVPDAPAVYSVGGVDISQGSTTVAMTAGSTATWSPSWATRWITVIDSDYQIRGPSYDLDANNNWKYTDQIQAINTTSVPATLTTAVGWNWKSGSNCQYAIYQPKDNSGSSYPPVHRVRFYFVSISKAGTRRPDVLNSPYVEFPWGLTANCSTPQMPVNLTAAFEGVTMTLTWTTTLGLADPTIEHYNIYRVRGGYYGTTESPAARPYTPYAIVNVDRANNSGTFSFNDHNFIIDASSQAYDLDPTKPGIYWYYVTSVGVDGLENTMAYGGFCTAAGTTITQTAGDMFIPQMVGQTIKISGSSYTITGYTNSTTITVGVAPTAGSNLVWTVGAVVRAGTVVGNTGAESDPTIYRDNTWNRLYNANFYTKSNSASSVPLTITRGAAYTNVPQTTPLADGQIPYVGWNPNYTNPSLRQWSDSPWSLSYSGYGSGASMDSFTIWECLYTSGAGLIRFLNPTLSAGKFNGEMQFYPGTNPTTSWLSQIINKNKFVLQENLVLHCAIRSVYFNGSIYVAGTNGAFAGTFYMNVALTDVTTSAGNAYVRWRSEAAYPFTNILSTAQRFALCTKLHIPDNAAYDLVGMYSFTGSSTTGTYVSGTNMYTITDCTSLRLTLGAETADSRSLVSTTSNTIVISAPNYGPPPPTNPTAGTYAVQINFANSVNDYAIEACFRVNQTNGDNTTGTVAISNPMLNGGALPANFTVQMNPQDWPGGANKSSGGADGGGGYGGRNGTPDRCVTGDAIIRTASGLKEAQDIVAGDILFSWQNGRRVPNKVEKVHRGESKNLMRIYVTGGRKLQCTDMHKIAIRRRKIIAYVRAKNLLLGDEIVGCDGHSISNLLVECLERVSISSPISVFDFTLEKKPHNYIANGMLCHNKLINRA